jgi:hypothetical protein
MNTLFYLNFMLIKKTINELNFFFPFNENENKKKIRRERQKQATKALLKN